MLLLHLLTTMKLRAVAISSGFWKWAVLQGHLECQAVRICRRPKHEPRLIQEDPSLELRLHQRLLDDILGVASQGLQVALELTFQHPLVNCAAVGQLLGQAHLFEGFCCCKQAGYGEQDSVGQHLSKRGSNASAVLQAGLAALEIHALP